LRLKQKPKLPARASAFPPENQSHQKANGESYNAWRISSTDITGFTIGTTTTTSNAPWPPALLRACSPHPTAFIRKHHQKQAINPNEHHPKPATNPEASSPLCFSLLLFLFQLCLRGVGFGDGSFLNEMGLGVHLGRKSSRKGGFGKASLFFFLQLLSFKILTNTSQAERVIAIAASCNSAHSK